MYEVTCPSCHAVVNSPFVRIGAVVTCEACKHRYLIDASHVKRVHAAKAGAHKVAGTSEGAGAADTGTPQPGGIHDLSEMMRREAQRERDSQFDDYDTIAPEPAARTPPVIPMPAPVPVDMKPPATSARRHKAIRSSHLIAAAAALALAIFGIGLWSIDWSTDSGAALTRPEEIPVDPGPVYEGPIFQGLPLLESELLGYSPWQQPNTPYESSPQANTDVYVTDDGLVPAGAGVIDYVGRVVSDRPGVILAGELSISLVNPQGMEKARTTVPLALVSQDHSLLLRVPIPANLDPTTLHPAWAISIDQVSEASRFIKDVSLQTEAMGTNTMAHVTVFNDTGMTTDHVTMVITAWGDEAQPLRRWRVHWHLPLKAGDYVEFFARTAVNPAWYVREWTVSAAAD